MKNVPYTVKKMNFNVLDVKVVYAKFSACSSQNADHVLFKLFCFICFFPFQSATIPSYSPRHCEGISINGINAMHFHIVKIFTIISHHETGGFTLECIVQCNNNKFMTIKQRL